MRVTTVLAMAVVICGVAAGPALADRGHHKRGYSRHGKHDRSWHGQRRYIIQSEPDVYYAPPPVVYVPAYPSPGINLIFPLRIR